MAPPARFAAYLAAAGPSASGGRIVLAVLLIVAVWGFWTVAVLSALPAVSPIADLSDAPPSWQLVVVLVTFAGAWIGLALAQRRFHRLGLAAVLGPWRWRDASWGLALGAGCAAAGAIVAALAGYVPERTGIGLAEWAVWLVPLALLIAMQSGAEEALFRGYVLQRTARRFRSPVAWAGIPALLFGLLHADPGLPVAAATLYVATTAVFGLAAATLVWRTGGLAAAIGLHTGFNLAGLLVVGVGGPLPVAHLWTFPETLATPLLAIDAAVTCVLLAVVLRPVLRDRAA